jgi:hypothetical protein
MGRLLILNSERMSIEKRKLLVDLYGVSLVEKSTNQILGP